LTLEHVGDLDLVLGQVNLSNVTRLKLDVIRDVYHPCASGDSWESLCARLVRLRELCLSTHTIRTLTSFGRLGHEFRAVLSRLRRLEIVWPGKTTKFVEDLIEATGPALCELVLKTVREQRIFVQIPGRVRANLEFLEVADQVLIPVRPSLSPPDDFLRAQVDKAFE